MQQGPGRTYQTIRFGKGGREKAAEMGRAHILKCSWNSTNGKY